jgi:general stress protein CsbA
MSTVIITSDTLLKSYIPNIISSVKGETDIYDKLTPFIESAEQWFLRNFLIIGLVNVSTNVKRLACEIVVSEAYRNALPHLDLILTPNGFATTGNQNLSPASKMRVDRLVGGLIAQRDKAMNELLHTLPSDVSAWGSTPQGSWFSATLFPTLDVVLQSGVTEHVWDKYLELRPRIIDIEASLAEDFFSPELMAALRQRVLSQNLQSEDESVVSGIQAQIIAVLRGECINMRKMTSIVNFIRDNEDAFPQWHSSDTAKLFSPPIFQNKKQSQGYFF